MIKRRSLRTINRLLDKEAVRHGEASRLRYEKLSTERSRHPEQIKIQRGINKEIKAGVALIGRIHARGMTIDQYYAKKRRKR